MTAAEYIAALVESGLEPQDAERIARLRFAQNRQAEPGQIRVQQVDESEGEILIYEAIGFDFFGDGMTPKKLTEQLSALGKVERLTVRINSPGGSVFDAVTMLNILRRQKAKVAVEIEGLAASAASFLAQAADPGELRISEAGMMMIHRAWAWVMGNQQDMIDMAALLEKLDGQIADIYASRSKRRAETWLKLMDDETWFTGAEAVEAKLADATVPVKRAAASLGLQHVQALGALPEKAKAIRQRWEAESKAERESEAERQRRDAEAVAVRMRRMQLEEVTV